MFDPFIAPSGTLLGLLQRGRGDGTLHALAAPRAEALAALNHCVLSDPRHDWQVENRSLYYARLYLDLDGGIEEIEQHLSDPDDHIDTDDSRTGLALAVLGHLASYGRSDALALLRRYAATGANWAWALDELALRDDDAGLRTLAVPVLARFPDTEEGTAELAAAVRDAFEPRPWRLWADDPREAVGPRVRSASEQGSFDRWQRQMRPGGPRPGWSVQAVFDWAQQGLDRGTPLHVPAARCLTAVAGPDDRPVIVEAARSGTEGALRGSALPVRSQGPGRARPDRNRGGQPLAHGRRRGRSRLRADVRRRGSGPGPDLGPTARRARRLRRRCARLPGRRPGRITRPRRSA